MFYFISLACWHKWLEVGFEAGLVEIMIQRTFNFK